VPGTARAADLDERERFAPGACPAGRPGVSLTQKSWMASSPVRPLSLSLPAGRVRTPCRGAGAKKGGRGSWFENLADSARFASAVQRRFRPPASSAFEVCLTAWADCAGRASAALDEETQRLSHRGDTPVEQEIGQVCEVRKPTAAWISGPEQRKLRSPGWGLEKTALLHTHCSRLRWNEWATEIFCQVTERQSEIRNQGDLGLVGASVPVWPNLSCKKDTRRFLAECETCPAAVHRESSIGAGTGSAAPC